MADHRVEHRLGEQRGAGVVEVEHLVAAGGEGPGPVDVDARHPARRYRSDGVSDSAACRRTCPSFEFSDAAKAAAAVRLRALVRARARAQPAGRPRGHRPRPAPDRAGLQGAPARDHLRGRPGLGERQPAQVPALLQLPEPGRGVDRRRLPLLRRLRARVGGHLEDAAVPGQGPHAEELLRLLPRARRAHGPRGRGRRRPTAPWCTSAPPRGTGTTTTSSTSATR